jgi:hypothetical protein
LESQLIELLLGDRDGSLKRQFNSILACLPGPLEGGMVAGAALPVEEAERIKNDLSSERITMASVLGLASAAVICQFSAEPVIPLPAPITAFQAMIKRHSFRI